MRGWQREGDVEPVVVVVEEDPHDGLGGALAGGRVVGQDVVADLQAGNRALPAGGGDRVLAAKEQA